MEKQDMNLTVSNDGEKDQFIQVPIKKKEFGTFITNLLGQPETIDGNKTGEFVVTFEWLVHVHHVIDQRINQQASADLVDFSASFIYTNGTARKITNINAFLHFNEAKLVSTKRVKLTWTYLVNFPGKESPEKQEISLLISVERNSFLTLDLADVILESGTKKGFASYKISHTERTWGDDVQSLINRELEEVFKGEKWHNKFLERGAAFIALALLIAGFILPDYIGKLIREKEVAAIFGSFLSKGQAATSLPIDQKLNLAIKLLTPGVQDQKIDFWFRVASAIGGIFLGVFSVTSLDRKVPSFIVITKEDEKNLSCHKDKHRNSLVKKFGGFAIAIASGVAGNYVYYLLKLPQ